MVHLYELVVTLSRWVIVMQSASAPTDMRLLWWQ